MTLKKAKTNTRKLAAVTLSVAAGLATLAMPAAAQAQSYHNGSYAACKSADKDAQVVGGLLGAVVGGVLGSQVSGNGARTEGSVLGAVLGGAAGAGIGDSKRKCRTEAGYNGAGYNDRRRTTTYDRGYSPAPTVYRGGSTYGGSVVTVGHSGHNSSRHNRTYRTNQRGYDTGYTRSDRSYDRSYERGYDRRDTRLEQIDYRIDETRRELERVKRKARYNGHRYTERRIYELGNELRSLKKKRKRIKRGYSEARRSSHYHGSNVCYTTH